MAMETRAIAARWDADLGQVTVWSTTQAPQVLRRMLARFLRLPEHDVRVVTRDIGGGFGPKAIVYPEDILVPLLARRLGRPVRFVESRREHMLAVTQERDQWHEAELGLTRTGEIVALRDRFTHDCGAFVSWGIIVPLITSVSLPGPYRVPNFEVTLTAVYTNRVPVTPVRGAGRPQAVFVMERLLDLAAARLGLDRVALRAKNLIPPSAFPYDVGLGRPRRRPSPLRQRQLPGAAPPRGGGGRRRGLHSHAGAGAGRGPLASASASRCSSRTPGSAPTRASASAWMPAARCSCTPARRRRASRTRRRSRQVVADELSVPLDRVTVVPGDTAGLPYGVGTFASRIAVLGGASAARAGADVRAKALALAADRLEAAAEDLVMADGVVSVRGVPDRKLSFAELSTIASSPRPGFALPSGMEPGLESTAYVHVTQSTYSSGAHAAIVEVDADTGGVRLHRYVAVDDCGTVINPIVVEGQIHGGVAHGIGNALLEEVVYDAAGQLLTGTLMDYALPRADDVPSLEVHHVVTPSPLDALGVKGAGEGGTLPAPAAIANAVADALAPLGVEITEIPLTRERLWRSLRARTTAGRGPESRAC